MKDQFNTIFLIALLVLVGYATYIIFAPFLVALFLAFIFFHLFKKWFATINGALGNRKSIASLVLCLIIFVILIIPVVIVSLIIISEINQLLQNIRSESWQLTIQQILNHPLLKTTGFDNSVLAQALSDGQFASAAKNVGNFFFDAIRKTYQGTSHFVLMSIIMFFSLYYLFKDGDRIERKMMALSPLKDAQEKQLIDKFVSVSRATLMGNLVVAIIQGILTAVIFWIAGVPSAAFWGLVTTILSLIPMLGSAVVWLPAGIILLLIGNIWQGIFVLLTGGLVVSSIDNILRPKLVEGQTSLHPLLVFLSTIGGILVFGITGFIIGPVIVVLFLTLLDIYKLDFKKELKKFNK